MRKLIWARFKDGEYWGCSECAWTFKPLGPPNGLSMDEMQQNFQNEGDTKFASHVCARHPKPRIVRDERK
jgi:hypothetical protein